MASELDKLLVPIGADISEAMASLTKMAEKVNEIFELGGDVEKIFRRMGAAGNLTADKVELLAIQASNILAPFKLGEKRIDRMERELIRKIGKALELDAQKAQDFTEELQHVEEVFKRKLMANALADHQKKMAMLSSNTQNARYEMIKLSEASQQLRIPTQAPRPSSGGGTGQSSGGGVNFVRVTAAAAQLTMMARVTSTMRGMGQTMSEVGRSSQITASHMTRFRMGLQAVPVNPALNVVKNGLDSIGSTAGKTIDKLRGIADAILSDLPGAASAAVGAMGSVTNALDSTSATASKHVSQLHKMQGSLSLLSTVFPFAAESIARFRGPLDVVTAKAEGVANKLDEMNASVGTAAAEMRGKAYVMTGAFKQLGGSADIFARSQYYALLPQRLLMREFEGGQRIVKVATHAFAMLTHPIHAVSLAIGKSRAEWKDLNARLPQVTGGLNLAARSQRLFAQSAYIVGTATRTIIKTLTPVGRLAMAGGRGLMSMINPAKSAATSLVRLSGVQNTFIGKALGMKKSADEANASLAKMGNQTGSIGSRLGGAAGKAMLMAGAMLAMVAGAATWGASTAMATEKNNVVFGTMLHDMEQGKAVVSSLQGTKAAGLFDNQELLDSGRLLFKAGVSATDLAGKTDQLATIATATSTELGDLTRIYQQGANAGSFGLDKINQLAERGIDIYGGLTAATGKSGGELKKMISDGEIGITQMDAALAHLTDGHGIYAGAMENVSGTAGGMMTRMKNNTQQALGSLMGYGLAAFKPILAAGVMSTDKLKTAVTALEPVFVQSMGIISTVMNGAWAAISQTASGAFTLIFGEGTMTFDSVITWMASMLGAATFIFSNLGTIANYAWTTMKLGAVMAFNDVIYFFTDVIPAHLDWFSNNWRNMFRDMFVAYVTFFNNLHKNIWAAMTAIWDFIASGGTKKLEFAFVPMMDGFKKTIAELPTVPDRPLTQMEQQMAADLGTMGTELGNGLQQSMDAAVASIGAPTLPEIKDKSGAIVADSADATAKATDKKAAENKAVLARSSEGQSVFAQMQKALGKGTKEKQAQQAAIDTAKDIKDIARQVRNGTPLVGKNY